MVADLLGTAETAIDATADGMGCLDGGQEAPVIVQRYVTIAQLGKRDHREIQCC
jgi:hypothetical protein